MIINILFFHCSFVDMLNIISTCRDILCVDINVDKRCVDHSTSHESMVFRGRPAPELSGVLRYARKFVGGHGHVHQSFQARYTIVRSVYVHVCRVFCDVVIMRIHVRVHRFLGAHACFYFFFYLR